MSKKRIIAIITIIVLLFAAGISVGVFLYGRAETEATEGSENITTNENEVADNNQDIDGTLAEGNVQSNENNENPEINFETDNEGTATPETENITETENNEIAENNDQNANNNTANNNNVADNEENNAGVVVDDIIENIEETTITRVEEQERLVSEDFLDWWQPMSVNIIPTQVGVEMPQITVKKAAITGSGDEKLVYIGQDITYVIAVTNNSDTPVEDIEITDKIPENTTYVADSIEDAVIVKRVDGNLTSEVVGTKATVESENRVVGVKWIASIPAGETLFARFTVNVNKTMLDENNAEVETIGTILNNAIANGEQSNDVQTSIIRTHKSSVIKRLNEETQEYETVETAKSGDLITYTISIENTGDVEGTTYIRDEAPEGTQFISAQEGAKIGDTSIVWSVTIPAHTTITREFTVKVTNLDGLIKNIAEVGGTPTNEDIIDTANIDVVKTATAVKRAGEEEFTTPVGEVKENDVIQYTIVVTNAGSRDLTNVLLEEQLEGVEVTKLVVDNVEKAIEKDVETGKLIIGDLKAQKEAAEEIEAVEAGLAVITAEYVVTYDVDIKGKGNEDGSIIPIYNKVNVIGETVPNPEDPNEVTEQVQDNDDETVPVAPAPSFTIVKTAVEVNGVKVDDFSAIKVKQDDIVKYEIVVTNTGNIKLTNILVTDTLKVRIDTENGDLKEVNPETGVSTLKTIESLVSGDSETIITYYKVDEIDMTQSETINNIATATTDGITEEDDETIFVNPNITLSGNKIWAVPDSTITIPTITVKLEQNGEPYIVNGMQMQATLTSEQRGYTFDRLPKYTLITLSDGTEQWITNEYSVKEDQVTSFKAPEYSEIKKVGYNWEQNITNIYDAEDVTFTVNKIWHDEGNSTDRPDIIIDLYKNDSKTSLNKTIKNTQNSCIFEGLEKYTIIRNDDGTITFKENTYRVEERTVTGYDTPVKSDITNSTTTFTNTITNINIPVRVNKVWNIPEGIETTGATGIRIYVYKNGEKMTDKYLDSTYGGTTSATFNLPKYKTNADETIYINSEGNVELNTYTVQEEENKQYIANHDGNTITNTAQGIVEEITSIVTTTTTTSPVDVVFVLDVSNSMKQNNRITNMRDAVNNAMTTIMNYNESNRVGIVAFASDVAAIKTATLQNIQHNTSASISLNGETLSGVNGSITVRGATYTQTGIEKGAQMLINDTGEKDDVKGRTPILILITDGEPTYYNTNYQNIGSASGTSDAKTRYRTNDEGERVAISGTGPGYETTPMNVFYTILTANYWKEEIAKKYGISNVYTVGMDLESNAAKAVLNPTAANISAYTCSSSYITSGKTSLQKLFTDSSRDINKYDYSDDTYMKASITTQELISKLNSFLYQQSHTVGEQTTKRMITADEVKSNKVVLENVDNTKEFTITCEKGNYSTLQNALDNGVVTHISGTKYQVNLDVAGLRTQVSIKYNKKNWQKITKSSFI